MSFGYSVGDFVTIIQLTYKVYKSCKSAPAEFVDLSHQLSSLHIILHELSDEASLPTSLLNRRGIGRKPELELLLGNLSDDLGRIEDISERYHSLGREQKKVWDRVRFASEDLATLRAKLMFHVTAINSFQASISASALARIEDRLDEVIRDIREGRKEPSIISSIEDDIRDDEAVWGEIERELVGDGITRLDVDKHKDEIKNYLIRLVHQDQENVVLDLNDSELASPTNNNGSSDIMNEGSYIDLNGQREQYQASKDNPVLPVSPNHADFRSYQRLEYPAPSSFREEPSGRRLPKYHGERSLSLTPKKYWGSYMPSPPSNRFLTVYGRSVTQTAREITKILYGRERKEEKLFSFEHIKSGFRCRMGPNWTFEHQDIFNIVIHQSVLPLASSYHYVEFEPKRSYNEVPFRLGFLYGDTEIEIVDIYNILADLWGHKQIEPRD